MTHAWAAGFFDGEGHVQIRRTVRDPRWVPSGQKRAYSIGFRYSLQIGATNRNVKPLEVLRDLFGGRIYLRKLHSSQKGQAYSWELSGELANRALTSMLPFLIAKADYARIAMEFRAYQVATRPKYSAPMSLDRQQRIEAFRGDLQRLVRVHRNVPEDCARRSPASAEVVSIAVGSGRR